MRSTASNVSRCSAAGAAPCKIAGADRDQLRCIEVSRKFWSWSISAALAVGPERGIRHFSIMFKHVKRLGLTPCTHPSKSNRSWYPTRIRILWSSTTSRACQSTYILWKRIRKMYFSMTELPTESSEWNSIIESIILKLPCPTTISVYKLERNHVYSWSVAEIISKLPSQCTSAINSCSTTRRTYGTASRKATWRLHATATLPALSWANSSSLLGRGKMSTTRLERLKYMTQIRTNGKNFPWWLMVDTITPAVNSTTSSASSLLASPMSPSATFHLLKELTLNRTWTTWMPSGRRSLSRVRSMRLNQFRLAKVSEQPSSINHPSWLWEVSAENTSTRASLSTSALESV